MAETTFIHPWRYPTLYTYMLKLPAGLSSYPEAQTTADLAIQVRERLPSTLPKEQLPKEIFRAVEAHWVPGQWISEVAFMTLLALARDLVFDNDDDFLRLCYDLAAASYSGKVMRSLMHFASPTLLLMGASKRWSIYKRGTELRSIKLDKHNLVASLHFPPNLYHKLMLRGFAQSFAAAIEGTRARNVSVEVQSHSSTECKYNITWQFG